MHFTRRKGGPQSAGLLVQRFSSGPILYGVFSRIRIGPSDANGGDILRRFEIHEDPLRGQRVMLLREFACQVGIALPVACRIPVGLSREFVRGSIAARIPAMR